MGCAPVRRDNPRAKARGLSLRTGAQPMLYLTCTTITSIDLAHYGVSRAQDWVSVKCGTIIEREPSGHDVIFLPRERESSYVGRTSATLSSDSTCFTFVS